MANQKFQWVSEQQAAEMIGLTPKYLRRRVREGYILGINYSNPSRNVYRYNLPDIEAHLLNTSSLKKTA